MVAKKKQTHLSDLSSLEGLKTGTSVDSETICKTVMVPISDEGEKLNPKEEFAAFVLISGPESMMGQYWKVGKKTLSVGRSRECGICIPESSVSKNHFLLSMLDDGRISITDAHSTNGTFVNNTKLDPAQFLVLSDNDLIEFGNISLKFLNKGNPEISAAEDNFKRSFTDHLTGAGNRLLLNLRAPEMVLKSRRTDCPLSVLIFDIDHFKKINDQHGHLTGDFILKKISSLGRSGFRANDLFVRSGGEEFCIFVHCSLEAAHRSMEAVRMKIQQYQFVYANKTIPVTISAGIALYKKGDKNWKEIYERADKALYRAKESGRNKVQAA